MMKTQIENGSWKLTSQAKGGEIISMQHKKLNKELIWQGENSIWQRKAPLLFPFIGNVRSKKFCYNGNEFEAVQHGFVKDEEFSLSHKSEGKVVWSLDFEKNQHYPFSFVLTQEYEVFDECVKIIRCIENKNNEKMFFAAGEHFTFDCDLNNSEISFTKEKSFKRRFISPKTKLLSLKKEAMTAKTIQLSDELFRSLAFIIEDGEIDQVFLKDNTSKALLKFSVSKTPKLFALWKHNQDSGNYLCIEPWHGFLDDENANYHIVSKKNLITLDPFKAFTYEVRIEIEKF